MAKVKDKIAIKKKTKYAGKRKSDSREQVSRKDMAFYKDKILHGRVLSVDPSSGSKSSDPGWAIFQNGILEDAGIIELPKRETLRVRLRLLFEDLVTLSEGIDVVLIEEMPIKPIRVKSGFKISDAAFNSLIQSVGASKVAFPITLPTINVPASLWSRIAREHGWAANSQRYTKTDTTDAVRIGLAALHILGADLSSWEEKKDE